MTSTQQTRPRVFAIVPAKHIPALREKYFFYDWDESRSEVRWMCSFDTTAEDVNEFAETIRNTLSA